MAIQNSLNKENLTIQKDGVQIEDLTNTLNFLTPFVHVSSDGNGTVTFYQPDRIYDTNPGRSLNTAFIPDVNRTCSIIYTVRFQTSTTIGGGTSGQVDLQISDDNISYTTISSTSSGISGGLILGIAITQDIRDSLTAVIPPNTYVKLTTSGNATITLVNQYEVHI